MDSCKGVSSRRSLRHSAVQPHRMDTPETLRTLLKARIGAVIGDGPLIEQRPAALP
jgi:hypothetical protein